MTKFKMVYEIDTDASSSCEISTETKEGIMILTEEDREYIVELLAESVLALFSKADSNAESCFKSLINSMK